LASYGTQLRRLVLRINPNAYSLYYKALWCQHSKLTGVFIVDIFLQGTCERADGDLNDRQV